MYLPISPSYLPRWRSRWRPRSSCRSSTSPASSYAPPRYRATRATYPYPYPVPLPLPVQIPEWLSWVQYLCGLKYGMNLFILNEFGKGTTEVWGRGGRRRRLRLGRRLRPNPYRNLTRTRTQGWGESAQRAAKAIVDNNDIEPDRWWVYLLILLVLI